jgi:hypothetical protein
MKVSILAFDEGRFFSGFYKFQKTLLFDPEMLHERNIGKGKIIRWLNVFDSSIV